MVQKNIIKRVATDVYDFTFSEVYVKANSWQCRNYVGRIILNTRRGADNGRIIKVSNVNGWSD